ncbi:nuclear RNA export factor 2-like [Neophocaena asiaeorientalis asiaeorientalis]|uniref:Nuclear RNA export factor 2-like n=1 Tax=Neophocaena asiaeorientalis asiaeorientalis TaxID=1706337 RepID=A0A341C9S1_NEOAA|nr:nuclear RNA export factor 2-like [Neophocaena asiaeorientalis asiaeorientalis]
MSGIGPTHQQNDTSFRNPRPCSQRPRNLALPTSEPALAPGLPGPQPHPPAGQHQFQDTPQPAALGSSPTQQWANTSFWAPPNPAASHEELALPTSRLTLDTGPLAPPPPTAEPSTIHQWASANPGTSWGTAASSLMTQPHTPVATSLCTRQGLSIVQGKAGGRETVQEAVTSVPPDIKAPSALAKEVQLACWLLVESVWRLIGFGKHEREYGGGGRSPQGRKKGWSYFPGNSGERCPHYEHDRCDSQPSQLKDDDGNVVKKDVQEDPESIVQGKAGGRETVQEAVTSVPPDITAPSALAKEVQLACWLLVESVWRLLGFGKHETEYSDGGRPAQGRKKGWSSFPGNSGERSPHYEHDRCEPQPSQLKEDDGKVVKKDVQEDPEVRHSPCTIRGNKRGVRWHSEGHMHTTVWRNRKPLEREMGENTQDGTPGSWFRVTIPYGIKYDKTWLMNSVQSHCSVPFTAVDIRKNFHFMQSGARFFVQEASTASALMDVSCKIRTVPYSVRYKLKPEEMEQLKLTLSKRFDVSQQALDLRRLRLDPGTADSSNSRGLGLKLEELWLQENPLCDTFPDQSTYVRAIRECFPKLLRLDGQELPSPVTVDVDTPYIAKPCKRSFLGSDELKSLVLQFLQHHTLTGDRCVSLYSTGSCKEYCNLFAVEVEGSSQGCVRAFTQTFTTTPASYSSLFIMNDELFVWDVSPKKTKSTFSIPVPTPSTSSMPSFYWEQQQMVQAFSTQSRMNLQWSQKYLQDNKWNYTRAGQVFSMLKTKCKIPEEAFKEIP